MYGVVLTFVSVKLTRASVLVMFGTVATQLFCPELVTAAVSAERTGWRSETVLGTEIEYRILTTETGQRLVVRVPDEDINFEVTDTEAGTELAGRWSPPNEAEILIRGTLVDLGDQVVELNFNRPDPVDPKARVTGHVTASLGDDGGIAFVANAATSASRGGSLNLQGTFEGDGTLVSLMVGDSTGMNSVPVGANGRLGPITTLIIDFIAGGIAAISFTELLVVGVVVTILYLIIDCLFLGWICLAPRREAEVVLA